MISTSSHFNISVDLLPYIQCHFLRSLLSCKRLGCVQHRSLLLTSMLRCQVLNWSPSRHAINNSNVTNTPRSTLSSIMELNILVHDTVDLQTLQHIPISEHGRLAQWCQAHFFTIVAVQKHFILQHIMSNESMTDRNILYKGTYSIVVTF